MKKGASQKEWQQKTYDYVAGVNEYLRRGMSLGWDNIGKPPEPRGREHLVEEALNAVRMANETNSTDSLRSSWPPAHFPLISLLSRNGQNIPSLCLLDDYSILARIGAPYLHGHVVHIRGDRVQELEGITTFGRSPCRRFFAIAKPSGVSVHEGWQGAEVCKIAWPSRREGLPDNYSVRDAHSPLELSQLIPFPDGQRVLAVSNVGIFVLAPETTTRLVPSHEEIIKFWLDDIDESSTEAIQIRIDMEHGAVSNNGSYIAVGHQDSKHLVYDANLNPVASIGNMSSYPHFAIFSEDDSVIAFNSCHFYNGETIGILTDNMEGLDTESYVKDSSMITLQEGARVYAGVSRNNEFIVGDAYGYLRCFTTAGEYRWQHFIGSSISAIDVSHDGRSLVAATAAGYISIIQLDAGEQHPYQIGDGNHLESRRWLFWRDEPKPLIW